MPGSYEESLSIKNQSSSKQARSIPRDCTVLIIEKEVSRLVSLTHVLEMLGIYYEWKASGFEVVEYANSLPHLNLILMDISLPFEDCYLAIKNFREAGQFAGIPIIAMGFNASVANMNKARASGFDGFIGNPLEIESFQVQIKKILSGYPVWGLNKTVEYS